MMNENRKKEEKNYKNENNILSGRMQWELNQSEKSVVTNGTNGPNAATTAAKVPLSRGPMFVLKLIRNYSKLQG